jgi:TRAP-type C4-dicarboxylate transport system permease small subunit
VKHRLEAFARMTGLCARIALWTSGFCLVLMTAFVSWQVYGRFVLNQSPNWTEPGSVMLMSWFIFLGAAVGTREGFHLSFDLLVHLLPPGGRTILNAISDLVVLVFGLGMVVYGLQLVIGTWSSTLPALGFRGGWVYVPVAAGGVLVALFSAERLARRAAGLPIADPSATGGHAAATE